MESLFTIDRDIAHFKLFKKTPAGDPACPDKNQNSRSLKHCNNLIKKTKAKSVQ